MPKSSFVDFKAVKAAITMEQLLQYYSLLDRFKKSGDSLSGPCPIHKGSNSSQFRVSISKNIWNCFSECKHGGNTLDFIARMEGISIHAAALKAVEWFNLDSAAVAANAEESAEPERETKKSPPATPPKTASQKTVPEASGSNKPLKFKLEKLERNHPYLAERGLTQETIIDFGVGYCEKGMMKDRIAIPIHNVQGEILAYVGRWPGEPPGDTPKYKLPQGFKKSLELFNLDRALKEPKEKPLVIVEGFFDCLHLHQHGCRKVVALMGSTLSVAQEELLRKYTSHYSQLLIMLDEDEAGRAGREDMAVRLSKFAFVKIHVFQQEDQQPEHLSAEEIAGLFA